MTSICARRYTRVGAPPDPAIELNNAGQKLRELIRLCEAGPVIVWLVAEGTLVDASGEVGRRSASLPTPFTDLRDQAPCLQSTVDR
jgi:hypothetical protein